MIQVYQIFYRDEQRNHLDPQFIPFDNSGKTYPYNYEYAVFFDLYKKINWSEQMYLGAVSWKFRQKTGLTSQQLNAMINENPNKDVYFVNPFPDQIVYENCWIQGEDFHPGITRITKKLLEQAGYSSDILDLPTSPCHLAYCNYWVGNKKFWDSYIDFLTPIWSQITKNSGQLAKELELLADPNIKAPYLPFIFERLFSTYLTISPHLSLSLPIAQDMSKQSKYLSTFAPLFKKARTAPSQKELPYIQLQLLKAFYRLRKWKNYDRLIK